MSLRFGQIGARDDHNVGRVSMNCTATHIHVALKETPYRVKSALSVVTLSTLLPIKPIVPTVKMMMHKFTAITIPVNRLNIIKTTDRMLLINSYLGNMVLP
jgi:hypothetical protein